MRTIVDVLFAVAALVAVLDFVPESVPRRRIAGGTAVAVVVIAVVAVLGGRVSRQFGALAAPHASPVAIVCSGTLQRDPAAATGALDEVRSPSAPRALRDGAAIASGTELVFAGWIAGFGADAPAQSACLDVDGRIDERATGAYGVDRPDVANALRRPGLAASGYDIHLATARLAPGVHRLTVAAVEGARYRPLSKTITVRVARRT